MSIKVSLTTLRAPDPDGGRKVLLSSLAQHASPEALAALRRVFDDPALAPASAAEVQLDPALAAPIELDPTLGRIELDPCLTDYRIGDLRGARDLAARDGLDALASALDALELDEKNTAPPTLHPSPSLVDKGADARDTPDRPPIGFDEPAAAEGTTAAAAPPEEAPGIEENMVAKSAAPTRETTGDIKIEEEAAMAHTTSEAGPAAEDTGAEASAPAAADESNHEAAEDGAVEPESPAVGPPDGAGVAEAVEAESEANAEDEAAAAAAAPAAAAAGRAEAADVADDGSPPVADDLFEAVPEPARHFLALLAARGELLMPEVMAHLGLVRPKGVGGAIEPIQRLARLIGVPLPFVADFAPSGHKRWRWRARPLTEVPAEALEPLPMPPPQQKKPKKKKADRSRYKREWKRGLGKGRRKAAGKGGPARKGRGGARKAPSAPPLAGAAAPRPAPRFDESGNVGRAPRRGAATSGEGKRRRFDRPMPEVFRRANRPAERPSAPPARREHFGARVDESAARRPSAPIEERPPERPTGGNRPVVPRLERPTGERPPVPAAAGEAEDGAAARRPGHSPEERLPLPRSGVFRRRTVSDTDVPVVVIRRRKR